MGNNWFFFIDIDGRGSPYIFPTDSFVSHTGRSNIISQITSFVDNSINHSRNIFNPGTVALQEAFSCISKFTGSLILKSQRRRSKSSSQNIRGFKFNPGSNEGLFGPVIFGNIMSSMIRRFSKEAEQLQSLPLLSLAAALVPPFNNLSSNVLLVPVENNNVQMHGGMDQIPCEVERQGCSGISFSDLKRTAPAVEPRTGIEFPIILDNFMSEENNSRFSSEVLVGTGSRTMKIVKIKSLKIYAFGFYIHHSSLCEKLGSKYASIPLGELNNCRDFYQDLLREDIGMTLRLVVNYSGMKVNTVKDAFEKSLRARLIKTNPDTDYNCLTTFGSHFTQDISLPAGTIIDFRRTADGRLITEIGGNQIGVVESKDLCRAFFDMYVGDVPVSEQTKEEIGRNVATIMSKC